MQTVEEQKEKDTPPAVGCRNLLLIWRARLWLVSASAFAWIGRHGEGFPSAAGSGFDLFRLLQSSLRRRVGSAPSTASSPRGLDNLFLLIRRHLKLAPRVTSQRACSVCFRRAKDCSGRDIPRGRRPKRFLCSQRRTLRVCAFRIVAESIGAQVLPREPTGALCGGAARERDSTSNAPAERLPMTRPTSRRSTQI